MIRNMRVRKIAIYIPFILVLCFAILIALWGTFDIFDYNEKKLKEINFGNSEYSLTSCAGNAGTSPTLNLYCDNGRNRKLLSTIETRIGFEQCRELSAESNGKLIYYFSKGLYGDTVVIDLYKGVLSFKMAEYDTPKY